MPISIRRATLSDAPAIARVRIDSWRATYRGLIPDAYLDGMQVDASTAIWERILAAPPGATSVFVADRDGETLGFSAGNALTEPRLTFDAELTAVYLRREFQRVGLGRRLVCAVAEAQRAYGASGMIAWVIAGNRAARAFYERLGATMQVEQPFEWDGIKLTEVGYGFTSLDALVADCESPDAHAAVSTGDLSNPPAATH